mmetsp:Transcript_127413/g.284899  ORF Transcript_127413/g.284899 Transcript_127413/m.284899 type:complete len:217 (-) Transcript_127413:67-717(-)
MRHNVEIFLRRRVAFQVGTAIPALGDTPLRSAAVPGETTIGEMAGDRFLCELAIRALETCFLVEVVPLAILTILVRLHRVATGDHLHAFFDHGMLVPEALSARGSDGLHAEALVLRVAGGLRARLVAGGRKAHATGTCAVVLAFAQVGYRALGRASPLVGITEPPPRVRIWRPMVGSAVAQTEGINSRDTAEALRALHTVEARWCSRQVALLRQSL